VPFANAAIFLARFLFGSSPRRRKLRPCPLRSPLDRAPDVLELVLGKSVGVEAATMHLVKLIKKLALELCRLRSV